LVHSSSEGRETLEQIPATLHRRWSLELPGDQTWSGRFIFIVSSILQVLERQSYLLSLISMLVEIFFFLKFCFNYLINLGMEYNIS
jgi:hypothetical protein